MKSTRVLPVLKSSGMMIWTPSAHKNQTQENQANDDNDLNGRQPELEFAEEFDTKVVDKNDGNKEHCDESSRIDPGARHPELED